MNGRVARALAVLPLCASLVFSAPVVARTAPSFAAQGVAQNAAQLARQMRNERRAGSGQAALERHARASAAMRADARVAGEELQALIETGSVERALERSLQIKQPKGQLPAPLAIALTRLQYRRGDIEGAQVNVDAMLKGLPEHPDLAVLQLRLSLAGSRYSEARRLLEGLRHELHDELARDLDVALLKGRASEMMGSDELLGQAIALLQRAHDLDRARADVTGLLARALGRYQRSDQAAELVSRALVDAQGEDRVELLYAHGFLLRQDLREDEAVVVLREVLTLSPGHAKARVGLARSHIAMGELEKAAEIVEALSDDDPRNLDALMVASTLAAERGDWDAAAAPLEALLEIKPRHLKGLWLLSRVRARQRRLEDVAELVRRHDQRKLQLAGGPPR